MPCGPPAITCSSLPSTCSWVRWPGLLQGDDRVGVAVDDEGRHRDLREVLREVLDPGGDALARPVDIRIESEPEGLLALLLGHLELAVGAEEGAREAVQEARRVGLQVGLHLLDRGVVEGAVGVGVVLPQAGRDRRGEDGAAHPVRAVRPQVPGDLTAAHGEADEGDVAQVEVAQHRVEVIGEGVVVVRAVGTRLVRPAEAPPVVGEDPVARRPEGRLLARPRCSAERPAVDQDDGPAVAPGVLDVEGVGAIVDRGHR